MQNQTSFLARDRRGVALLVASVLVISGCILGGKTPAIDADADLDARITAAVESTIGAEVKAQIEALAQVGAINLKRDQDNEQPITGGDGTTFGITGGQGDSILGWLAVICLGVVALSSVGGGLFYQLILRRWRIGHEAIRGDGRPRGPPGA